MRARRCLLLAFFAYILLDLGSPFVPGAFTFDPADSVEAVSGARARPAVLPRIAGSPFAAVSVAPVTETPTAPAVEGPAPRQGPAWRPRTAEQRRVTSEPRSSVEDD